MHNRCSICDAEGISICMINNHTIDVCKECGGVFVQELNIVIQLPIPLKYDNNFYAVSYGIAMLYKQLSETNI